MSDKKISELTAVSDIRPTDISVLVRDNADYKYTFALLVAYVAANISTGANISFGNIIPQNTYGKNGDVFFNSTAISFAQKISGAWTVVYTFPSFSGTTDGTVLYGTGTPGPAIGNNNDTYIDTASGIFYKKAGSSWSQAFSMQTGPQGPQGISGTNGTNGSNGYSILNGPVNPSNTSTGSNGDFYINTITYTLFGPKTDGLWGTGVVITGDTGPKGDKGDTGATGLTGPKGDKGDVGDAGATGAGVPVGGATGQVLSKINNDDYNTEWSDPTRVESATEDIPGILELATISEALARTDDQKAMTALKSIALILDEKKNVNYQIAPVSLNEVSFLMRNAGNVTSITISGANSAKLKIGTSGTYPPGAQTYPFAYAAGDRVFVTYNYTDLTNASCNIILTCRDN